MAKKIQCEVCGATGLVKEGNIFVCQECGVGYKLEDMKKLVKDDAKDNKQ